ncbi:MAG: alpha/beta fold hydrolase [Phycicoccus sp.]
MEQIVHVGGAGIAYSRNGTGPGLVLLHGGGASKDINWGFLEPLHSRYTVVALDWPGSGGTTDDGSPLHEETLRQQVLAVADHSGLEEFHLVGYSLGGHLALGVAAAAPQRIRSLTVIAGWVAPDPYLRLEFDIWQRLHRQDPALFAAFAVLTGSHPDLLATGAPEDVAGLVDTFAPILAAGTSRQAELMTRSDLTGRIESITAPTHVIGLTADRQVPIEHSRRIAAAIPGATTTEIDAGHIAPWQAPQELAEAVISFLDHQPR